MKRFIQMMLFLACVTTASVLSGCNAASLTGPQEITQPQDCEDDSCSNGHNI